MKAISWVALLAGLILALGACAASSDSSSDGDSDPNCSTLPGTGSTPSSGSGTASDPYMISLGQTYQGCSAAGADPGPIYAATLSSGQTVSVDVVNYGDPELELWLYDSSGNTLEVYDSAGRGNDIYYTSSSTVSPSGLYGAPRSTTTVRRKARSRYTPLSHNGPGDGPFTLITNQAGPLTPPRPSGPGGALPRSPTARRPGPTPPRHVHPHG